MIYKVCILTISDRTFRKEREDRSGPVLMDKIRQLPIEIIRYDVVPDEIPMIVEKLIEYTDRIGADIVLTTGGTGWSPRDVTPEATKQVIEREVPGIPEAMRAYGMTKTPRAMLSRSIAGLRGKCLIVNCPGSTRGATESMDAIIPALEHGMEMIAGKDH